MLCAPPGTARNPTQFIARIMVPLKPGSLALQFQAFFREAGTH
jgi:hypothetical protein